MTKHIAIIGAGIAGLAAGCCAQMNGYSSEIFELHTLPGGLCTSWKRHGYTFDGCIHWLVGSNPRSIGNFYMAGQWVEPGGGVPTAALSGRNAVKLFCKADGKQFGASEA